MSPDTPSPTIPGFRSETATVNGIKLHYWIGGDPAGRPVLLWHGFLATGYVWREVAPALAEAGLAVLVPEMRGYGDSDKPAGDDGYDGRALAEEARALVAQIGFGGGRPLIVAAHDMGAPPALLWAADHPREIATLFYIEMPVMVGEVLRNIIAFTPEAMSHGSMWWWILPHAPNVPETLIVGKEREFLQWFYQGEHAVRHEAFTPAAVDETLRTFAGREGVLGALGVYRTAFTTIAQTEPLLADKVTVPVVTLGGVKGVGDNVGPLVSLLAENVESHIVPGCGHFLPEECPQAVTDHILAAAARLRG